MRRGSGGSPGRTAPDGVGEPGHRAAVTWRPNVARSGDADLLHGTQIDDLPGRTRGGRHRPRLLPRPHADAGAAPVRDRRADDGAAARVRAARRRCAGLRPRHQHRGRTRPVAPRPHRRHRAVDRRRAARRERRAQGLRPRRRGRSSTPTAGAPSACGGTSAREKFERQERLAVSEVPLEASRALAGLAARSMRLQCTIQEGHVFVSDGAASVPIELKVLKAAADAR